MDIQRAIELTQGEIGRHVAMALACEEPALKRGHLDIADALSMTIIHYYDNLLRKQTAPAGASFTVRARTALPELPDEAGEVEVIRRDTRDIRKLGLRINRYMRKYRVKAKRRRAN